MLEKKIKRLLIMMGVLSVILVLLTGGDFLSARNMTNLARQVSLTGVLAVSMTLVILTGGIDLSVGSLVALSGVVAAWLQLHSGGSTGWAAVALSGVGALGVGTAFGISNGLMVTALELPPFIATLGVMVIARGLALVVCDGASIAPVSEELISLGQGYVNPMASIFVFVAALLIYFYRLRRLQIPASVLNILVIGGAANLAVYAFGNYRGMPLPVVMFLGLAFCGHFLLNHLYWGRYIVATGSNLQASFLAGLPVHKVLASVYTISGAFSGLVGLILTARLNGAMPTAGELFELDAIAAVVIGGTRLTGGQGSIVGTVLGVFFLGMINNGMSLMNMTEFYQKIFKGLIILVAVAMDRKK